MDVELIVFYKNFSKVIKCGIKSRIPIHCILWFIFIWVPANKLKLISNKFKHKYVTELKKYNNSSVMFRNLIGYIPCPVCKLLKNFKKVRHCTVEGIICEGCKQQNLKMVLKEKGITL